MTRVLIREGEDAWNLGHIYLEVVQLVIIYKSETCTTTLRMGMVWGRFHHRVAYSLTGWKPRRGRYRVWVYPPLKDAILEAGLQEVEAYVYCCQNKVTQFIVARPIMELCLVAERMPGSRVAKQ